MEYRYPSHRQIYTMSWSHLKYCLNREGVRIWRIVRTGDVPVIYTQSVYNRRPDYKTKPLTLIGD